MITMGIDASTTCTGYSIFDGTKLIACGKLVPNKDLEWRERIQELAPMISNIIKEYKPTQAYVEDVPLMVGGGTKTLVILGAVQGSILGLMASNGIKVTFIGVSKWRSEIGLFTGKRDGTTREMMKKSSIEYANEKFGLELVWKSKASKMNDDDISDSINVAWSQIKPTEPRRGLGRK